MIELLCALLEYAATRNVRIFALLTDQAWHDLLYTLAERKTVDRALIGDFDWDSGFPQSPVFAEAIAPALSFVLAPCPRTSRCVLVAERADRGTSSVPDRLVCAAYEVAAGIQGLLQYV